MIVNSSEIFSKKSYNFTETLNIKLLHVVSTFPHNLNVIIFKSTEQFTLCVQISRGRKFRDFFIINLTISLIH